MCRPDMLEWVERNFMLLRELNSSLEAALRSEVRKGSKSNPRSFANRKFRHSKEYVTLWVDHVAKIAFLKRNSVIRKKIENSFDFLRGGEKTGFLFLSTTELNNSIKDCTSLRVGVVCRVSNFQHGIISKRFELEGLNWRV